MDEVSKTEAAKIGGLVNEYLTGRSSSDDAKKLLQTEFQSALNHSGLPSLLKSLENGQQLITMEQWQESKNQQGIQHTEIEFRLPGSADGDRSLRVDIEEDAHSPSTQGAIVAIQPEHDARQSTKKVLESAQQYIDGKVDAATSEKKIRDELRQIDQKGLNEGFRVALDQHNRLINSAHSDRLPYATFSADSITLAPHQAKRDGDKAITITEGPKPTATADMYAAVPTDEKVRQLLADPAKFKKLYANYCRNLSPDGSCNVTPEALKADMQNINLTGEQKLVASALLAAFDDLRDMPIHRVVDSNYGRPISTPDVITKDDIASYADFLDPKEKNKSTQRIQQRNDVKPFSSDWWGNVGDGAFKGGMAGGSFGIIMVGPLGALLGKSLGGGAGNRFLAGFLGTAAVGTLIGAINGMTDTDRSWWDNGQQAPDSKYDMTVARLRNMIRTAHVP